VLSLVIQRRFAKNSNAWNFFTFSVKFVCYFMANKDEYTVVEVILLFRNIKRTGRRVSKVGRQLATYSTSYSNSRCSWYYSYIWADNTDYKHHEVIVYRCVGDDVAEMADWRLCRLLALGLALLGRGWRPEPIYQHHQLLPWRRRLVTPCYSAPDRVARQAHPRKNHRRLCHE